MTAAETATDLAATDLALNAIDITVSYRVRSSGGWRARRSGTRGATVVHALRNVSFHVARGEKVGLIGPNGAGKSTLMNVMTGVLTPDSGEVWASAEPAVLSLGGLLNARYTGRTNIEISLLALGWHPVDIKDEIGKVIEFTELGDAIDRPLGSYSSGMGARLKFAIATCVDPEILLIDEALAVGDERFREKSEARLDELTAKSGSIVLVTHNLQSITAQCDRAVWLHDGEVRMEGDPKEVITEYRHEVRGMPRPTP